MKISLVCHGNIARSQILHHYLAEYAGRAALALDLFSCGTASRDTYPDAEVLLAEVQRELNRRGLHGPVQRNVLDEVACERLAGSELILVADHLRRQEVLHRIGAQIKPRTVQLFYEFIGEGPQDFIDTYDAGKGTQDPERFARCFGELERIARLTVDRIRHDQ